VVRLGHTEIIGADHECRGTIITGTIIVCGVTLQCFTCFRFYQR